MTDTDQLLRRYVHEGSEHAFGELVARHINLVYSVALRQTGGNAHLSQDIAQTVFTDLARKAKSLPPDIALGGWLYRHTYFTAAKARRADQRRQAREWEVAKINMTDDSSSAESSESLWQRMAPVVDEAMNALTAADRDALVLRFFEGQDLRAVGAAFGINEDAAQKRVTRALERLRSVLARRGVGVSATALAAALGAPVVCAAPAGLAAAISAISCGSVLAGGAAGTLFTLITMTKLKLGLVGSLVAASIVTPFVIHQRGFDRLRQENRTLREQIEQLESAGPAATAGGPSTPDLAELDRLRQDQRELLRLRAEVNRLRNLEQELQKLRAATQAAARTPANTEPRTPLVPEVPNHVPRETWGDAGFSTPHAALQTRGWAVDNGNVDRFKQSITVTDGARKQMDQMLEKMIAASPNPATARQQIRDQGLGVEEAILFPMMAENRRDGYTGFRVLTQDSASPDATVLAVDTEMASGKTKHEKMKFQRVGPDWKVVIDEDFIEWADRGRKE